MEGLDGWEKKDAYRVVFLLYAAFGGIKLLLMLGLTPVVEAEAFGKGEYQSVPAELDDDDDENEGAISQGGPQAQLRRASPPLNLVQRFRALVPPISQASKPILFRLLFLFAIDAFASGMASPSWLTYFFTTMHSLEPGSLGMLFFVANLLSTVSNLLALPVARRFGPLKTMVFAHLPSTVFLAMIPLPGAGGAGTFLAMSFLALRACTQTVDQAPRQAFISAVVLPAERTAILGVLNTAKTLAQAGGTGSAGVLAGQKMWVAVISGAGLMKAAYDLLMLWMFMGVKERDEAEGSLGESRQRDEEAVRR